MSILRTDEFDIAYENDGGGERGTVVLLHGWPDDASAWDAMRPALHRAGLRTIVPTLRGFGDTRFRTAEAQRTGNSGILAMGRDRADGTGSGSGSSWRPGTTGALTWRRP